MIAEQADLLVTHFNINSMFAIIITHIEYIITVLSFSHYNQLCVHVGKQFWPELIGVPTKLAKEIIEKENPSINDVPIILNGTPVPADFRCNRVRLFDNILGDVVQIPWVA